MRWIIRKAVENPVLVNIVFWLVVIAGVWTAVIMPKEEFPQVGIDQVYVYVGYASGALEEGEESVVRCRSLIDFLLLLFLGNLLGWFDP